MTTNRIEGMSIPDCKLARQVTEVVRDTESPLLFNHSSRVYYFSALAGKHRNLKFDPRVALSWRDVSRHGPHASPQHERAVRSGWCQCGSGFLRRHGIAQQDIYIVLTAIALHTTPGIPQHMHPIIALLTAGVEMDVLGIGYAGYSNVEREAVARAHPRTAHFKEDIIQAFYDGIKHRPASTFGNVKADVLFLDAFQS